MPVRSGGPDFRLVGRERDRGDSAGSVLQVLRVTVPSGLLFAAAVTSRHSGGLAVVLAVLGGVVFVVLTVCAYWRWRRRSPSREGKSDLGG